jgi:Domain of unknown function (DUF4260)
MQFRRGREGRIEGLLERTRRAPPALEASMAALMSKFVFASSPAPARACDGFASGGVRAVLRLEGAAALAAAVALYAHAGFSWPLFALLLLAPDLAMLAYLIGPKAGAFVYNLAHTYALAPPLALAGFFLDSSAASALGLIWVAHIGLDRMLGYGLNYESGFGDTHLGRFGKGY